MSVVLWTCAAVVTAQELELTRASLRCEAFLASIATVAMGVMTVAATLWWLSVQRAAPAFFGGSTVPLRMLALTLVMAVATAVAAAGSVRALRA